MVVPSCSLDIGFKEVVAEECTVYEINSDSIRMVPVVPVAPKTPAVTVAVVCTSVIDPFNVVDVVDVGIPPQVPAPHPLNSANVDSEA